MSHSRPSSVPLRRFAAGGLGLAVAALGLPALLTLGSGPASAQQAPAACPSATPSPSASAVLPTLVPTALPSGLASASPSPSATPTATTSPTPVVCPTASATPTATTSPGASATPTATTSPTPSTSATPTASTSPSAPATALAVRVSPGEITPGVRSRVTITGAPGASVELLAYSRPSTRYGVVRSGTVGPDGTLAFEVLPGTNTRLYARYAGFSGTDSRSVVIDVRTALSLTVVRNGRRDYTFQGRILPRRAGQLITLYRVDGDREVLTSQIKTDSTGTWRIQRVFTGSGRFGFLARTGQNLTNVAGVSNGGRARPTDVF